MNILSFGDFYLGIDKESFTDVSIHLLETKKVKEYVYKRPKAADKKLLELCHAKTHDICVTTHESQHYIGPNPNNGDEEIYF